MIEVGLWILIFVTCIYILIRSSDKFTDAAEELGLALGISPFIVGVTIVSIGTSLPELISSIVAVVQGSSQIVVGNVIGSNITNIFLILGLAALIGRRMRLTRELIHVDLPFLIGSAFLFTIMVWDGVFTAGEAVLSLLAFVAYLIYVIQTEKRADKEIRSEMKKELRHRPKIRANTIGKLAFTALLIYISAHLTITAVIQFSSITNIGTEIIALTAVALGTSLPELMVTISAARKGKPEMAVGNILGSNIFNTLLVMGIPAFIGSIFIPKSILYFGLPIMLIATLLFFFSTQDRDITRWEGILLLIFYILFITKVVGIL